MAYTTHGHQIPGTPVEENVPPSVYRCGGPGLCDICSKQVSKFLQEKIENDNVTSAVTISAIADPDAPVTTNEKGGSQSDIPVRFDLIDAKAMFEMAKVLDHGAKKYGANNWRKIDVEDHLNHLLMHTYAYLSGDRTDEHLSHILCRATFALGVALQEDTVADN
jgi:hypothetical protein